ncbi:hypothetical protein PMIN06_012049 [Paraphaeosphaeria minitans]
MHTDRQPSRDLREPQEQQVPSFTITLAAATCTRAMPALVVDKVVNHSHELHRAIDHERGLFHSVCGTCTRLKRKCFGDWVWASIISSWSVNTSAIVTNLNVWRMQRNRRWAPKIPTI